MNAQTRTNRKSRLVRTLAVAGLTVLAAGSSGGRNFLAGSATVAAQGPVLGVIAVPWAGKEGSAHIVYSGASVVLQAVASIGGDGNPVSLASGTWDPGDGSGPQVIDFSNSRVLELTHTYTGSDSTTFFATIAVGDGTTTVTDTFKVNIVPKSLDVEVNMAVDRSLWYNHKRMQLGVIADPDGVDHPSGFWTDDNSNASTSASVQAFEVNGHRESGDRLKDPYVDDTSRGLRFLEGHVQRFDISDPQGHAGTLGDPVPDTNGNGYGLQTDGGHLVYVGGQIIDAFVASGTPNATVVAGTEAGRTYKDLAQDMLDAYSYGQSEDGHGGWVYDWNGQDGIDSSSSGWWGVGARAGDVWGLTIPEWVKTRNFELGIKGTLQSYDGSNSGWDGSCGYRGMNGNAAESGACLIMMAADGVSATDPRYLATENWLRRGYESGAADAHGQIYAMYNITKAMRLARDSAGASAPITHLGGDLDWYGADTEPTNPTSTQNGFARYLVGTQEGDGSLGQYGDWVSGSTANSWGTLILSTALFEQGPIAICQADAIVCSAGATCGAATIGAFSTANFNGTQSARGDNPIASYKWDFQDPTSLTPTSTDVTTTHLFDTVGTYPVSLTVKDTKGNASTAICSVVVSIAALPPLASAGPSAGYAMCLGRSDEVVLTAAASIARGADIASYEWDIQAPTNFDTVNATGVTTNQTAYFTALGVGSWPIKLRVTDDHATPLVSEAGSTVTVRAADDAACNRPPVAVADSAETFSGTPVAISVLTNDTDPDTWQVFSVSSTTTPTSGTAVVNLDQTVTYTPNVGFAGTDTFNYTMSDGLDGSASALVTVLVTKRTATVTAGSGTKIYGAVDPTLTPSSSGFLSGITLTETARDAGEDVGSYATHATAAGATLANYIVTYNPGSLSVTKKDATVTGGSGTKIYGAADPTLTPTSSGFLSGITLTETARDAGENVGSYATHATAAGATLANYNVTYDAGSLSVTMQDATVTGGSGTKVYGSADPTLTPTSSGFLSGITVTETARDAGENVGSYATHATAAGATIANYNVTYNPGSLSVTKLDATVTAGSGTKVYGSADPTLTPTSSGFLSGITLTNTTRDAGENVGSYATHAIAGGATVANYNVTYTPGSLAVTKLDATVTAGSGTKIYASADPTLTPTSSVLLAGVMMTQTRDAGENVGGYVTHATAAGSALANYNVTYNTGSLSITRAIPVLTHPATGASNVDLGIFRPQEGRWYIDGSPVSNWGAAADFPVAGDYDGDGTPDIAVFRPANGTWYISGIATVVWGRAGDIPVPADYDGNGTTDIAVFRPSTGMWYIRNGASVLCGAAGDVPVPGDYDGDGRADIAVFRPATGMWDIRNKISSTVWGVAGDVPVPADFDGDGRIDVAVFRPATGTWYIQNQYTQTWGLPGDVPMPLDRDGDGIVELGVFRRATGTWYFRNRVNGGSETIVLGMSGDIPLGRTVLPLPRPGDFDGDRKADLTVFRPSTGDWVSLSSKTGQIDYSVWAWGLSTDVPVGRDYDGDGKIDPAVYRPSLGRWFVRPSSTNYTESIGQDWGLSTDTPVPADYDGDGKADFAVFRPSNGRWVILLSSTGNVSYAAYDWGLPGDVPMPADYDGDGRVDIAVFRPSTNEWIVLNRFTGTYTIREFGMSGDVPVTADFDGDGKADIAVFRPSLGLWLIQSSIDGTYFTDSWGASGDTLVPADYDGDGKADIAVYRPSTGMWYVRGIIDRSWGLVGDVPVLKNP